MHNVFYTLVRNHSGKHFCVPVSEVAQYKEAVPVNSFFQNGQAVRQAGPFCPLNVKH